MALSFSKLADIQTVASSTGSIYANPASTKSYIKMLILYNSNTTAEVVELYNVPDSSASLGTAAATNRFQKISLAADETLYIELLYPIVLTDTNDSIQAKTTTASKVTVQLLGSVDA